MDIDLISEQIINHPYFQKLKEITENNSYHLQETVYDHSLKTFRIAQEQMATPFISNPDAKKAFICYTQKEINGIPKANIMKITALVHDIGKSLSYTENGESSSILIHKTDGTTQCPGHEYWGSTMIASMLHNLLSEEAIMAVSKTVRLHDTYNVYYFETKKDWPIDLLINDIKSNAEGNYIECLFNMYCDTYTAQPAQYSKNRIEQLFNHSSLYIPRIYEV